MGRPTKLTKELVEKAKTYISTCEDSILETEKGGISYVKVNLPMVADLAIFLGINKDTVYDWCKGDGELNIIFSDIVKEINHEQEKRLINKGLGGIYQSRTTGMLLSKHGYAERTELTGKNGGIIEVKTITGMEIIKDDTSIQE